MELYVGGMAQGKLAYVKEKYKEKPMTICDLSTMEEVSEEWITAIMTSDVLYGFHHLVKQCVEQEIDVYKILEELFVKMPSVIIICNEVGAGIVPMKREERAYRELVGRTCCEIAKRAQVVERILCGVGVRIK